MMTKANNRYTCIDILRAIAMIAMIFYHAMWDLVYIFDVSVPWFSSQSASILQMYIRISFIVLSGFCWSMSRNNLKRGCIVYLCSWIITLVTMIFMPNQYILFGVLSLIGSAMLFTIVTDKFFKKIPPVLGIVSCCILFILFYHVNRGYIGIGSTSLIPLPKELYNAHIGAYLGFVGHGFHSTDYVPILPWIFIYWLGYFLYALFKENNWLDSLKKVHFYPLEWIGKHSLFIYMIHQPIVYVLLYIICM